MYEGGRAQAHVRPLAATLVSTCLTHEHLIHSVIGVHTHVPVEAKRPPNGTKKMKSGITPCRHGHMPHHPGKQHRPGRTGHTQTPSNRSHDANQESCAAEPTGRGGSRRTWEGENANRDGSAESATTHAAFPHTLQVPPRTYAETRHAQSCNTRPQKGPSPHNAVPDLAGTGQ